MRAIDADALYKELNDIRKEEILLHGRMNNKYCCTLSTALYEIENAPTIEPEIVRCHKCIYWNRDTVRQNSNDAGWWNEAVCKRYSDEIWTSWKDADWYCADAERRTDDQSK